MVIIAAQWGSMRVIAAEKRSVEVIWGSLEFGGGRWSLMTVIGDHWSSVGIIGAHCRTGVSFRLSGYNWGSGEPTGTRWWSFRLSMA